MTVNPYAPPTEAAPSDRWPEGVDAHQVGARKEWRIGFSDDAFIVARAGDEGTYRFTRKQLAEGATVRALLGKDILLVLPAPIAKGVMLPSELAEQLRTWLGDELATLRARSFRAGWIMGIVLGILFGSAVVLPPANEPPDVVWNATVGALFAIAGVLSRLHPSAAGRIVWIAAWVVFAINEAHIMIATGGGYWRVLLVLLGIAAAVAHLKVVAFFRARPR